MTMLNRIIIAAAAALLWLAPAPAAAQKSLTYGKVEQPWYPQGKISGGITVTSTSAPTALPATGFIAWVCNTGSNDAFLAFGGSTIAAVVAGTTGNGTWIKASTCAAYDLWPPFNAGPSTYIAAITASSTTTLTVETGIGQPPQQLVASGGGGGGGNVNVTQWATTNLTAPTAWGVAPAGGSIVPNMNVNCVVGCAGGSTSNATSGVATSSTNGAQVAYLYGFNGTTWDQIQVDGSKNLKVVISAGNITGYATSALQGTNTATTAHTCSTAGFSELGCLGQINDALVTLNTTASNPLAAQTGAVWIGNVGQNGAPWSVSGQTADGTAAANPPVLIAGTVDGTGTGAVAIPKITAGGIVSTDMSTVNGVTSLTGAGAVGTGSPRVAVGQDITTVAGSAPGLLSTAATIANSAPLVKGTTAAMTGTSPTQILAAVTSKVLYVTSIKCNNSSATGTLVQITDGSAGTVLETLAAGATFGGEARSGVTPLFWTTSGNGLFAQDVTTGASVICTGSGYSG